MFQAVPLIFRKLNARPNLAAKHLRETRQTASKKPRWLGSDTGAGFE